MRAIADAFDPAVWSPAFDDGEICALDLIGHEVAKRIAANAVVKEVLGDPARVSYVEAIRTTDFSTLPRGFVTWQAHVPIQTPTSLDMSESELYFIFACEENAIARPVVLGEASILSFLDKVIRVFVSAQGQLTIVETINGTEVGLVNKLMPGRPFFPDILQTEQGQRVVTAIQPLLLTLKVDTVTGRIANVLAALGS